MDANNIIYRFVIVTHRNNIVFAMNTLQDCQNTLEWWNIYLNNKHHFKWRFWRKEFWKPLERMNYFTPTSGFSIQLREVVAMYFWEERHVNQIPEGEEWKYREDN